MWGEWGSKLTRAVEPQLLLPTGAPLLFVIPWVVVRCLFENVQ